MNYQIIERTAFQVMGIKGNVHVGVRPELWVYLNFGEVNANGTADRLVQLMNGEIKGYSESLTITMPRQTR